MLHEILLSLAGQISPLWKQLEDHETHHDDAALPEYISPPERAMLQVLGNLGDLHVRIQDLAKTIASSHSSIVCRAVAASISTEQLSRFRHKVIEVERSLLSQDAGYVGAYGVVPLSTVVAEFAPWSRRLEWLWETTRFIQPTGNESKSENKGCTASMLMDYLRNETFTGYSDLEEMACTLLAAAEKTWMQPVAAWILYGKILDASVHDFFIRKSRDVESGVPQYSISWILVPKLISTTTAESILSIGNSLNHIRRQLLASSLHGAGIGSKPAAAILPQHLNYLRSLIYPLSPPALASAVDLIRGSISQNALSQLLPVSKILSVVEVIHRYLLLGSGEFAIALISQADKKIASRTRGINSTEPVRKAGRLDDLKIQNAEATRVLSDAWSDMTTFQSDEESQDRYFDLAKQLLRLEILRSEKLRSISTIFPSPAILTLSLPPDSSLFLFLRTSDIETYATITSYLLSIRRAELHLSALWKLTALRRCNPAPLGPPLSASRGGQRSLAARRTREDARNMHIRKHWATSGKVLFLLNELGSYLHGEVIARHWGELVSWIKSMGEERCSSAGSRPTTARSGGSERGTWDGSINYTRHEHVGDPSALAKGHRLCLRKMKTALFLDDDGFVEQLKEILTLVDHFIALFSRLQMAWQGLDLQEDEGVVDALTNYKKDEGEILWEMGRSGKILDEKVEGLVESIRRFAELDSGSSLTAKMEELGVEGEEGKLVFVPFGGRIIDRLIMKLEALTGGKKRETVDHPTGHEDED